MAAGIDSYDDFPCLLAHIPMAIHVCYARLRRGVSQHEVRVCIRKKKTIIYYVRTYYTVRLADDYLRSTYVRQVGVTFLCYITYYARTEWLTAAGNRNTTDSTGARRTRQLLNCHNENFFSLSFDDCFINVTEKYCQTYKNKNKKTSLLMSWKRQNTDG